MKESYYDVTIEAKVRKTIRVKAPGPDAAEEEAKGVFNVSEVDTDEQYDEKVLETALVPSSTIYVVSWEYKGGGGFYWFRDKPKALAAFDVEKKNADKYASDKWCACFFETSTTETDDVSIVREIEDKLDGGRKNPELFYSSQSKPVRAKSKRRARRAARKN